MRQAEAEAILNMPCASQLEVLYVESIDALCCAALEKRGDRRCLRAATKRLLH